MGLVDERSSEVAGKNTGLPDARAPKLPMSPERWQDLAVNPNARGRLEPGQILETRHVLAGRYRGKDISERALLTHTVVVDADDRDVRVLCGFRVEGMADKYSASEAERSGPPTCPRCLERWEKLQMQTNPRKRAHLDGPRGTERELARLRRDQDLVQQQLETAYRQGNTRAIERLREMERDLDRRVDALAFAPNGSDYYVWVLLPDGTPKDEGPYGPKTFESAKTFARIAATNGAHDRAVSRGLDPKSSSFEIVRRYRRGTGESV
jgi:hypothetical protein